MALAAAGDAAGVRPHLRADGSADGAAWRATTPATLLFNLAGAAIAALVMLPATFCAGMTLPLLTGALLRRGAGEAAIGRVYAANTLGAIVGVVLAVHIGLPLLGLKGTLLAGCLVDAVLGLLLLYCFRREEAVRAGRRRPAPRLFVGARLRRASSTRSKMTAGVFRHGELVHLARRQDPVRQGRQDRHRAPGAATPRPPACAPTASPTARSTRPRRGARHRRDHHGADRARCRSRSSPTRAARR